ncbi:MAG: phosphoribosyl-AMP cyclohydrolase [Candidatus Hodgkinia cicadicola]
MNLIPVIIIDFYSGDILMFAYSNELCLRLTLITKLAHYYSRTNQSIWLKGEYSGNLHYVQRIYFDCDTDSLIFSVLVLGNGYSCHTLRPTCFYNLLN